MGTTTSFSAIAPRGGRKRIQIVRRFPTFDWPGSVFEGWARNYVRQHFWRAREYLITEEDGLQECAFIFVNCKRLYEGKVDNPAWFMSLFKIAVVNEFNTFSKKSTRAKETHALEFTRKQVCLSESTDSNGGPLAVALAQASSELRDLTHAILNAPSELLGIIFTDDDTASISRRAKRMFRISGTGSRDLMGELRELLMDIEE